MSPVTFEEQVATKKPPLPQTVGRPAAPPTSSERVLFADSLLESTRRGNRRRGWATAISLVLQGLLLSIAVLVPLIYTEALPRQQLLTLLVAPPPPPPPPPPVAQQIVKTVRPSTEIIEGQLRTPTRIPQKIEMIREEQPPPSASSLGGVIGGVPGGVPGGQLGGVIGGIVGSTSSIVLPKAPKPEVTRVRISQGVSAGHLIHRVEPVYPVLARAARVHGQVLMNAIISRDGTIQDLRVLSGHPLLVQPALDAVRQWRYKPYLLNGEPVEVETTVTVIFTLSAG